LIGKYGDLNVDGRIISKQISEKKGMKEYSGLN
jgi:hypothetical protein